MTISALIVEDEPPARDRLREMLADHPDVVVTAEVGSVPAAMAEVVRERPDLIFLDIALPGDEGLTLVDLIGRGRGGGRVPAVVCVTAYADHAVRAFDAAVVDYLLKPFSRERLADSLARVREHLRVGAAEPSRAVRRLPIPVSGGVRFLDVRRIDSVRAERNYVRVLAGDQRFLVRMTMKQVEDRLPAEEFVRVNRSLIVQLDRVVEMQPLAHGEVQLRLATGELVASGRTYAPRVREALGL
ncbi:LytR/AlgR family response regulator transcription factor [Nocardioides speluncae]|uniref:LytR/AlgR family response regulator transcription factor n=1 Tax=Nocardioides speluncae TaxID=2670337 RepID=UPI000D68FAD4|nr:response regulator [Nocardioides speluncae]